MSVAGFILVRSLMFMIWESFAVFKTIDHAALSETQKIKYKSSGMSEQSLPEHTGSILRIFCESHFVTVSEIYVHFTE